MGISNKRRLDNANKMLETHSLIARGKVEP